MLPFELNIGKGTVAFATHNQELWISTDRTPEGGRMHQAATLETLNRTARVAGKILRLSRGDRCSTTNQFKTR
jgi:hypothetical protein